MPRCWKLLLADHLLDGGLAERGGSAKLGHIEVDLQLRNHGLILLNFTTHMGPFIRAGCSFMLRSPKKLGDCNEAK